MAGKVANDCGQDVNISIDEIPGFCRDAISNPAVSGWDTSDAALFSVHCGTETETNFAARPTLA